MNYKSFLDLFINPNETINSDSVLKIEDDDIDQIVKIKHNIQNFCYDKDWILEKLSNVINEYKQVQELEEKIIKTVDVIKLKDVDGKENQKLVDVIKNRIKDYEKIISIIKQIPEKQRIMSNKLSFLKTYSDEQKKNKSKAIYYIVK